MISLMLARRSKNKTVNEETLVARNVAKEGVGAFKCAGTKLKSDAKFILELVKEHPECLSVCEKVLFDRYTTGEREVENPVDEMLFASMCCEKNVQAFKYLRKDVATRYLSAVEKGELIKGSFQGKDCEIQLNADKDYIDLLKYIRFGYIKSHSLFVGCVVD